VIKEYKNNKKEFLINLMNYQNYLENICGIDKLINEINIDSIDIDADDF
jgi:hypothetical protein